MPTIRRVLALPLVLFLALALARCGGDGGGTGPDDQVPTTVQIANANIELNAIGATATLAVTVLDQSGQPISNPSLSFTSLSESVATVSGTGLVTAVAEGSTEIVVESGNASANANVTVEQISSAVEAVSGDDQTGQVGSQLPDPLVVRIEDSEGTPVAGEDVSFQVTAGGGTVSAATVTSDANGEASVTWTLGDAAGQQSVEASVGGVSFTFTATAEAGPPATFVVTGDGQSGVAGFALLASISITVQDASGNVVSGATVDLSASDGGSVTPATFTSGEAATIVDWTLGGAGGEQTLSVTAGSAQTQLTAMAVTPVALAPGIGVSGQSADPGETLYYTFETPASTAPDAVTADVMQTVLTVQVSGGSGERDLHVRRGSPPEGDDGSITADCSDVGAGTDKLCEVLAPPGGTWFAAVVGASGFADATVLVSLVTQQPDLVAGPLTVTPGAPDETQPVTIEGSITNEGPIASGPFDWRIEVDGNPVASGTVDDLGPDQSTPVSAQDVGPFTQGQHTATLIVDEADAVEDANPADNTSDVDFTVVAGPSGTLTIQKVIQSSEGGAPDNPADPSLAGFEFEIREAGTTNVVATVTTDASGQAQAAVPVGTYDVIESNSQGLTDVTTAADDQAVTDGGNVDLDWINRQPPPSSGAITIQKVIQSSGGGPPDNPADPALDGFEFEIRVADTNDVVATITTDAAGVAQATLPVGTYDIVESDSQGLEDFTAALDDQPVTDGGNLELDWINRQAPLGGNQAPTAVINGAPMTIPNGDGNSTVVMFYGGNSTDPDGDLLTYSWSAPDGTFVDGIDTGEKVSITFPGNLGAGGSYTVTLTVNDGQGHQDQVQTTIDEGPALNPAGTFDIVIQFIDNADSDPPTASQEAAFDMAEAQWEQIVRSELADFSVTVDAEECAGTDPDGDGTPGDGVDDFSGVVDDVRIFVFLEPIDGAGGVLGRAGPCIVRSLPTGLPLVGAMRFDTDDLAALESDGTLNPVILHEMGHVLGLGVYWNDPEDPCFGVGFDYIENPSLQRDETCTASNIDPPPDTRYTGPDGVAVYRALGGGDLENVPVENGDGNNAGPGGRDSHWREKTYTNELMTPSITAGEPSTPLSKQTIAGLADLMYSVDYAPADDFSLPSPIETVAPLASGRTYLLVDDIRRGPIWVVDRNGNVIGEVGHRR